MFTPESIDIHSEKAAKDLALVGGPKEYTE